MYLYEITLKPPRLDADFNDILCVSAASDFIMYSSNDQPDFPARCIVLVEIASFFQPLNIRDSPAGAATLFRR